MLPLLLAATLQTSGIERDAYGVPRVTAPSLQEAWRLAGRAVAEDRIWQMELSRRLARGRLAELLGKDYANSDREVLKTGYTDEELAAQFERLNPETQAMVRAYVDGVNDFIAAAPAERVLMPGHRLEPWTIVDSMAVGVRLFQMFGRGGAGELRNMALLGYLESRPNLKGKSLDVLDDFAWQNDPRSPVTVERADDPIKKPPVIFPSWSRKTTEEHLAQVPKLGLLELLPAIRLEQRDESAKVAQALSLPWKAGSYAAVVGKGRSATGYPVLLSAPQMGWQTPSIVHEMSIHAPGLDVAGLDVPGMPGIAIGATPDIAWGITSGVADTDDIVYYKIGPDGTYGAGRKLQRIVRTLKIRGEPDEEIVQLRTEDGPVVLQNPSRAALFARRSGYWQIELASLDAFVGLYRAKGAAEIREALRPATMSFNFFYATRSGDIGYRYLGRIPIRRPGYDHRLPVPGEVSWNGFVPFEQMPHTTNPRSGLLTNWNNKPVAWWPNGDTPVWGEVFRVSSLRSSLDKPKLNPQDVETAAWSIARMDETWPHLRRFVGDGIPGFDGRTMDGSLQAGTYMRFLDALRTELMGDDVGNFISPDFFRIVVQPSILVRALERRTRVDYLNGKPSSVVVAKALEAAQQNSPRFRASSIRFGDEPPVPYSNRGTYIQIIELLTAGASGRSVLPPGVSEAGPHSRDQVPLARSWTYKEMGIR
ncbi:MAG TPA: penicillin acylase family protein [Fimbriimonas sp.]